MRTLYLCLLAALALSVFTAPVVCGRTIAVDADPEDWTLTPPAVPNTGHIGRDPLGTGSYVWTDTEGDERTDFAIPDPSIDLTEFRITSDPGGLYIMAKFMDILVDGGDGVVQLQVAIDLDGLPGSGETWLGGFSETQVAPEAAWEYLVMTRFGSANPMPSVYDSAWVDVSFGAISALSPLTDCMEVFVPWETIGGPPAAPLRFTVAAFRSDEGDETWDVPGTSDALDAVTNYGDPGSSPNTWNEVGDGVIDSFFDVWFHLDPDMEPSSPLLITEVLYDPVALDPDHEWFEVHNLTDVPLDMMGYRIGDEEMADGSEGMMAFPIGSFIDQGQVVVIAHDASEFASIWSLQPDYELVDSDPAVDDLTIEPLWAGGAVALNNSGDELLLLDSCWTILDVVTWEGGSYPGVVASLGCGAGESLARVDADDTDDCTIDLKVLIVPGPGGFLEPVAEFLAAPNPAACGQSIMFDASSSFHQDPGRSIVIYEWDFDYDGGGFLPEATGMVVNHAYPEFGYFTVALRVTDDAMPPQTAIETVVLDVVLGNSAPVADANGPYTITLGNPLQLDGSGTNDPDGSCGDSIAEFLWDLDNDSQFDDATGETPLVSWATLAALGLSGTGNIVQLRVTDSLGMTDTDATTLSIFNNEPVAALTANPNPAACGQPIMFDGSGSSHQHAGHSIVLWEWDFDYDGSNFTVDASGVTVYHAYPLFGSYTAALRVTDDNTPPLTDIDTVVLDVSLGNTAPVADADGPYTITLGNPLQLDGSGTHDPDESCGDSIAEFLWDLDNDSQFDDATGEMPLVSWATLAALGLSGLGNQIALRVEDSFGFWNTDVTTLNIEGVSGITPEILPVAFGLHQNVPNPFNPSTIVSFDVPRAATVDLRIFGISGRLIVTLVSGRSFDPGRHEVVWTGRDDHGRQVPSGTYFYRLEAGEFSETKRMTLVK